MPAGLRAVLFDVDGTLVDSGYQHALAWWQAFRRYECDIPIATIHRAIGMGTDHLVEHVLRESHLPPDAVDLAAVDAAQAAIFSTHWPELRRLPGARDLIVRCREQGLITVLASPAGADELAVLRRLLDVDDHLDHVTDSSDAEHSKPDPDLVAVGLKKAGIPPEHSVFVGDAVWDVQAAMAAGVHCVGVECGGTSAAELREAGASETYRDPTDLLEQWDESVFARSGAI